ncbi:MAG: hypothetical protein H0W62_13025 [Chitinophagales bacterium]|nr:hypothetical protein [Chitinophagales bacterium]
MPVRSLFMYIGLSFFSLVSAAQYPDPSLMSKSESAKYIIRQLKQGALLVRLDMRTKAVTMLQEQDKNEAAEIILQRQRKENLEIISAFKRNFNFCPVYFFLSDSSDAARASRRSGYFLNDSMQADPAITLNENYFLIAEKGMLEKEIPQDKTQTSQEPSTRGTMEDALVIRDKNYNLLKDPFPYWVHLGNWDTRVRKLNKKFLNFYQH